MSVAQILSKAETLGVRVSLDGDSVKLRGPARAIAAIKPELAAHKPAIVEHLRGAAHDPASIPADCVGGLYDPEGRLYLPWAPRLPADDVRRMHAELIAMIEELCSLEYWPAKYRQDVLSRALRGPLADLMPNLAHFKDRLSEARAEAEAKAVLEQRTWRAEGIEDRRWCSGCDGSCVGTAKRCSPSTDAFRR